MTIPSCRANHSHDSRKRRNSLNRSSRRKEVPKKRTDSLLDRSSSITKHRVRFTVCTNHDTNAQEQHPQGLLIRNDLQSCDKKRRYMRRGSKSPSMLLKLCRREGAEHALTMNDLVAQQRGEPPITNIQMKSTVEMKSLEVPPQARRLSIMSLLKCSLEKKCNIETGSPPSRVRRPSLRLERRMSTTL